MCTKWDIHWKEQNNYNLHIPFNREIVFVFFILCLKGECWQTGFMEYYYTCMSHPVLWGEKHPQRAIRGLQMLLRGCVHQSQGLLHRLVYSQKQAPVVYCEWPPLVDNMHHDGKGHVHRFSIHQLHPLCSQKIWKYKNLFSKCSLSICLYIIKHILRHYCTMCKLYRKVMSLVITTN